MDLGLKGRTAIVTGGSRGIGKGIAVTLAQEGVNVAVCARESAALTETLREIEAIGGTAIAVVGNLTDDTGAAKAVQDTIEAFKRLDILVNNVGGAITFGGLLELEDRHWYDAFTLNVMSVVRFVRHALPWLQTSDAPRIINISSISGIEPGLYNPHYAACKAAVINLSKYLANQFAREQILVNAVCPGPVYSHAWDKNVERAAEIRDLSLEQAWSAVDREEAAKIPLGRIGTGADVAGLVAFLASDLAGWITGSCFHVNGGKLRSMS